MQANKIELEILKEMVALIVYSFPPVINSDSRLLLLGSMPGVVSLQAGQYYGYPRNHFWPILYKLLGDRAPDEDYDSRLSFALKHGIALWDSIAACVRDGSLDVDIKDAVPNDIPALLASYPSVIAVGCNGAKSFSEFNKNFGKDAQVKQRDVFRLPSTSPIPTQKFRGFEDRLEAWRVILEYV
ncbi:DNA-deoxyinosine glycosylase [Cohnella kolymensis]|uniref:DNA-deoxyinosine glycosylase n=1 Tax=Cohnella kolymensis TaxID=1590652 RepID=UPI002E0F13FB